MKLKEEVLYSEDTMRERAIYAAAVALFRFIENIVDELIADFEAKEK